MTQQLLSAIQDAIRPTVEAYGLELWGCELLPGGVGHILRVYIDGPEGVTIDDCANLSRQMGAVLDVEDPLSGRYALEVSSPGMNRMLFVPQHYQQLVGACIKVRLHHAIDGQRNFVGFLTAADQEQISLQVEENTFEFAYADIDKANVVSNEG